jgi:hypothetical protein
MSTTSGDRVARLFVRVSLEHQPQVKRHCPRCAGERRFASSGKFRVNAQGKTIDVWLIFRCTDCDYRWNMPVHERRPVGSLDPVALEALMRNDAALAERYAVTAAGSASADLAVALSFLAAVTAETAAIEMRLAVAASCSVRLDRLLAVVLGLPREAIQKLHAGSLLSIAPPARKALRRAAGDGMTIRLDLAGCPEALAARCRQRLVAGRFSIPAPDRPD